MRTTHIEPYLSNEELYSRYTTGTDSEIKKRWHLIWLAQAQDYPVIYAAKLVGHNKSWGCYWISIYNKEGAEGITKKRLRNPDIGKPKLTGTMKSELILLFNKAVPVEYGGGCWNGNKVKKVVWLKYHLQITRQTGWHLLREAGLTLQTCRPQHSKSDAQEVEDFKKKRYRRG